MPVCMRISLVGLLLGLPLMASGEADSTEHLDHYTVTAKPINARGVSIAQPVEVLSGEKLARERQSSLGETLANRPGVSASDFGQAASRPVIRGLGGLRVQLLSSGIAAMDISATSADHAVTVSPATASQIEVLKGPAALLYGSGAIGGVVNLVDNRIPLALPETTRFNGRAGYTLPDQDRQFAASLDTGFGNFALHIDGTRHNTGDYHSGEGRVENSDSDLSDRAIGVSWFAAEHLIGLSFSEQDNDYGIPAEDARIEMNQLRFDLKAELHMSDGWLQQLNLRLGASDYQHSELEGSGEVATLFENDAHEARLELILRETTNWSAMLGLQAGARDLAAIGEEAYLPAVESDQLAIFTLHSFRFDQQQLNLGLRLESQDHNPAQGHTGVRHDLYSLSAEWTAPLQSGHELSVTAGRAQRGPAAEELYASGPHLATSTFETGTANLESETANHLDLGLHFRNASYGWRLHIYANLIEDFIFQQTRDSNADGIADRRTAEGVFSTDSEDLLDVFYTQSDALFYGFELETDYSIFNDTRGELTLRGFADAVRGRLTNGDDLPRITPPRLGLGLDYQRGLWQAHLDVIHHFRQDLTAPLETETASYTLLNADLVYTDQMDDWSYTLRASADNLLDQTARRHTSFIKDEAPLPGRTAGLELLLQY